MRAILWAGTGFQLPVSAVAYERAQRMETREEMEERDCRKFQSESTVKFDERQRPLPAPPIAESRLHHPPGAVHERARHEAGAFGRAEA